MKFISTILLILFIYLGLAIVSILVVNSSELILAGYLFVTGSFLTIYLYSLKNFLYISFNIQQQNNVDVVADNNVVADIENKKLNIYELYAYTDSFIFNIYLYMFTYVILSLQYYALLFIFLSEYLNYIFFFCCNLWLGIELFLIIKNVKNTIENEKNKIVQQENNQECPFCESNKDEFIIRQYTNETEDMTNDNI